MILLQIINIPKLKPALIDWIINTSFCVLFNFQIAQQQQQQHHHQYQRPLYEYKHYNYNYNINQYNHSRTNFSNYKKPYCTSAYTDYPEKPIKMQREEIIIEHSQLVLNGNGATNENVGHHRSHHYTQVNAFYC